MVKPRVEVGLCNWMPFLFFYQKRREIMRIQRQVLYEHLLGDLLAGVGSRALLAHTIVIESNNGR